MTRPSFLRFFPVLTALALFCGDLANAQGPSANRVNRFARPPAGSELAQPGPLRQSEKTVVLKMTGDPVAVVRSRMLGKQISETDRQTIERVLRKQQDAIEPAITAMGGKVLANSSTPSTGLGARDPGPDCGVRHAPWSGGREASQDLSP